MWHRAARSPGWCWAIHTKNASCADTLQISLCLDKAASTPIDCPAYPGGQQHRCNPSPSSKVILVQSTAARVRGLSTATDRTGWACSGWLDLMAALLGPPPQTMLLLLLLPAAAAVAAEHACWRHVYAGLSLRLSSQGQGLGRGAC